MIPASYADIYAAFERGQTPALSWANVLDHVEWVDVELTLGGAAQVDMARFVKIRGALGRVLQHWDIDCATPALEDQPSAFRLMYQAMGKMSKALEYPKPFVLQYDPETAIFRVRLFGPLMAYATEIAGAMMHITRQKNDNPFAEPVPITERKIVKGRFKGKQEPPENISLEFLTPLSMRKGQIHHDDPASVLRGLVRRASGILAWYGLGLPMDYRDIQAQLAAQFPRASWGVSQRMQNWHHPSARQHKMYQEAGHSGGIFLNANIGGLYPLFQLSSVFHAGGKATIGAGRVILLHND